MRLALSAAVLLIATAPAVADDKKPPALTDKEIADGWLLLFDGETTFGWKIDGEAKVKDGVLLLGGGQKPTTATPSVGFVAYEMRLETEGIGRRRFKSETSSSGSALPGQPTVITISIRAAGAATPTITSTLTTDPDGVARSELEVTTNGRSTLEFEASAGQVLSIKSAKVKPLGLKPIFNGKDLSGWKVFPGDKYKSKFAVTPAGELCVTNGPGDLQTEKAYANFVLQLECKTNGKALNSGVFFRCLPDQYQNGYEAQIQNAYKDNDRTKPADFGTGAIYRRVPARKVVSNDNEWFTMTVVADGKHIATWVNGYPTVDWTDDRPADDNPRKGSKTGAGHISIQGHDPTTDLLFRNIRIAELPEKK
jgi:hypothetical protein